MWSNQVVLCFTAAPCGLPQRLPCRYRRLFAAPSVRPFDLLPAGILSDYVYVIHLLCLSPLIRYIYIFIHVFIYLFIYSLIILFILYTPHLYIVSIYLSINLSINQSTPMAFLKLRLRSVKLFVFLPLTSVHYKWSSVHVSLHSVYFSLSLLLLSPALLSQWCHGCSAIAQPQDSTLRLWAQICQLLPRHSLNAPKVLQLYS